MTFGQDSQTTTGEAATRPGARARPGDIELAILVLADGVRPDVLRALSESGDLPNITRHLIAEGSYLEESAFCRVLRTWPTCIWTRADLLSHPEFSPPGHGSLAYCETGLVWETRDLERGFGMFPYFDTRPRSGR